MIILQGVVTGRKAGTPKEDGRCFDTLRVESAGKIYFVGYDRALLPNVSKDQEIALACNISVRNNYLNFFANGHIADEQLVDLEAFSAGGSGKYDDFD